MRILKPATVASAAALLAASTLLPIGPAIAGGPALPGAAGVAHPMNGKIAVMTDAQVMAKYHAILASHTFQVGSHRFARLKSYDASSCDPGDTRTADTVARITSDRSATLGSHSYPNIEALYSSPDQAWAIESYTRHIDKNTGDITSSDGATPGNYSFNTSNAYSSVQSSVQSYVASLDIPDVVKADLNAQLSSVISSTASYANSLSSSAATIKHDAQLSTPSQYRSGAHYDAWINVQLRCVPSGVRSAAALQGDLKAWVDSIVAALGQ